jgi:hypothetical protein
MKKLLIIFSAVLLLSNHLAGQGNMILTSGSKVIVDYGAYFVNCQDVTLLSGSQLDNNGTLSLKGNLTNNGNSWLGMGQYIFNGSAIQTVGGSVFQLQFYSIMVNNNVQQAAIASVAGPMNFVSGKWKLNAYSFAIGDGATITGNNSSSYFVADGTGKLVRTVAAASKIFPVGTASSYVPITLSNSGTSDLYAVRVFADVLNNGTSGGTIPSIAHAVNMTWVVEETTPGGSNLSATCQWNAANEGASFIRAHSGIGVYASGAWNPQSEGPASGTNPYSLIRSSITAPGPMAVGDYNTPMAVMVTLSYNLKEFLEGPFTGTEMSTLMNSGGILPLSQPYNVAPWNYTGTESVGAIPNSNVVDWVLVELRDATSAPLATAPTRIARRAGFLLKNGQIVGLNGTSPLQFTVVVDHQLFAIVWYRNHLGVMSASGLVNIGGTCTYDFTTGSGQVYGGAVAHKQVGTGIWGMMSGDGDANNSVQNADRTAIWAPYAGRTGYFMADFSLDRQVNNKDKDDKWFPNLGKVSFVP